MLLQVAVNLRPGCVPDFPVPERAYFEHHLPHPGDPVLFASIPLEGGAVHRVEGRKPHK